MNFAFDSRNRLIQAGSTTYRYDAENQRVGVNQTQFVVNSQPALSQVLVKEENGVKTFYVYGLGLIGEETSSKYTSYHFDLRGSTVALTNSTGQVTEIFQYSPYGTLLSGNAEKTPFLFNGMYGVMTDSNGLYYMRARFYSPEMRRFVNQDILLGFVEEGQTLNRYAFVTGDPISKIDPFGLAEYCGECANEDCVFYGGNLCESGPGSFYEAMMMAFDWLFGTGPKHLNLGPETNQARDMRDAPGVRKAREFFKQKYANYLSCSCSQTNLTGYYVTDYIGRFKVWEFLVATLNLDATEHFVGSYRIDIYGRADGKISIFLNNKSSFTSFWEGIPPDWSRDTFGPMGNMTQTIYWTEMIKNCP